MSILCGAALTDDMARRVYLERFCLQYSQPLVDYLRYALGVTLDNAEDIVQEFWTVKLLKPGPSEHLIAKYLARRTANNALGFRQYLGRSIKNFYIDQTRRRGVRGSPLPLDDLVGWEPQADVSADEFDVVWASHILNRVVNVVRAECEQLGQLEMWLLFVRLTLSSKVDKQPPPSLSDLAAEHGFESAKQASNALQTITRKFRRSLRMHIADYLPPGESLNSDVAERQEIDQLLQILSRPGGVSVDILQLAGISPPPIGAEPTGVAHYPTSASFRLANLKTSDRDDTDNTTLWLALLGVSVAEYLSESGMPCKSAWQCIKLSDLPQLSQPDLDLLNLIRQRAKHYGAEQIAKPSFSSLNEKIPIEFHAVLYLTAIAVARTQLGQRITRSGDDDLNHRIQSLLSYRWLDQRTLELLTDLSSIIQKG